MNGIFLGTAVSKRGQPGWQIVAANERVLPVEGLFAATFQDATELARRAYWSTEPKAA